MEGGHINLKCSDFLANVFSSFNNHHNSDLFTDVTLVSDDNKKIQAHKLILSAGSEYFRDVLSDKSHPHPMLCLDGVSSEDLACIIKYLYVGEVSVPQSSLQKFLKIANKLKCFGLNEAGPQGPGMEKSRVDNEISHKFENEPTPIKDISLLNKNDFVDLCNDRDQELFNVKAESEIANEPSADNDNELSHLNRNDNVSLFDNRDHELVNDEAEIPDEEVLVPVEDGEKESLYVDPLENDKVHMKTDPEHISETSTEVNIEFPWYVQSKSKVPKSSPDFCKINGKPLSKYHLYELLKEYYYLKQDMSYQCKYCDKNKKNIGHMREHTQKHVKDLALDCDICGEIVRGTDFLRGHKRKHHPNFAQKIKIIKSEVENFNIEEEQEENDEQRNKEKLKAVSPNVIIDKREHSNNISNAPLDMSPDDCEENPELTKVAETFKDLFCKTCNVRFKTEQYARCHFKTTHLGMRFPCNYCDYKATTKYRLKLHTETQHFNVKAQCSYCGKQVSKSFISRHIQETHKQSKPHKCGECSYETHRKEMLKEHIEAKHEIYICSQCDYKTKGRRQIRDHERKHHT